MVDWMVLYNGWCPSDNASSRTARAQYDPARTAAPTLLVGG